MAEKIFNKVIKPFNAYGEDYYSRFMTADDRTLISIESLIASGIGGRRAPDSNPSINPYNYVFALAQNEGGGADLFVANNASQANAGFDPEIGTGSSWNRPNGSIVYKRAGQDNSGFYDAFGYSYAGLEEALKYAPGSNDSRTVLTSNREFYTDWRAATANDFDVFGKLYTYAAADLQNWKAYQVNKYYAPPPTKSSAEVAGSAAVTNVTQTDSRSAAVIDEARRARGNDSSIILGDETTSPSIFGS